MAIIFRIEFGRMLIVINSYCTFYFRMSLTCNTVSALDKLVTLLIPQLGLVSTCWVDMIELDLFSMLPISVQSELISMTEDQLGKLPTLLFTVKRYQ